MSLGNALGRNDGQSSPESRTRWAERCSHQNGQNWTAGGFLGSETAPSFVSTLRCGWVVVLDASLTLTSNHRSTTTAPAAWSDEARQAHSTPRVHSERYLLQCSTHPAHHLSLLLLQKQHSTYAQLALWSSPTCLGSHPRSRVGLEPSCRTMSPVDAVCYLYPRQVVGVLSQAELRASRRVR